MYREDRPPYLWLDNNTTRVYSPLTLSREWSTLGRLVLIVASACVGSIINGFFVAAFFVEHGLKRIGNVFHACVGLSDMFITAGVMPISAVVLLSGVWDIAPICKCVQFLTETSTYCYSIFFTLVAAETYLRVCRTQSQYDSFISMGVGLVVIVVFVIGIFLAAVGTFLGLDYDYCERVNFGNYKFRIITFILFHGIPFILTSYCLIASAYRIRLCPIPQVYFKRTQQYERDLSTIKVNIIAFTLYVSSWIPHLVITYLYPDIEDSKYYHTAWIGICRSLITSFLYSCLNKCFRHAFSELFYYCCCKSNMNRTYRTRHRRVIEYKPTPGDVRVHIMHQAVNLNNPQRGASSSRETYEL